MWRIGQLMCSEMGLQKLKNAPSARVNDLSQHTNDNGAETSVLPHQAPMSCIIVSAWDLYSVCGLKLLRPMVWKPDQTLNHWSKTAQSKLFWPLMQPRPTKTTEQHKKGIVPPCCSECLSKLIPSSLLLCLELCSCRWAEWKWSCWDLFFLFFNNPKHSNSNFQSDFGPIFYIHAKPQIKIKVKKNHPFRTNSCDDVLPFRDIIMI